MRFTLATPALLLGVLIAAAALAQTGAPAKPPVGGTAVPAKPVPPKPQAAKPPAPKADPVLVAAAQKMAGAFSLSSADGTRTCPLTLKADPVGANFAATIDGGACSTIAFALQVSGWTPDDSGSIRLLSADGRLVSEFTESTGGVYEALREGDGVYFLASPAATVSADVSLEEMLGDWDLVRAAGSAALCRWTLTGDARPGGGYALRVTPGCNAALAEFSPSAWRIEGGNVVVTSASGATPLRFARQEDGGWAKTPERGRPLLLLRQ